MPAAAKVKPLGELSHQYVWSLRELGAMLGRSYQYLLERLVDDVGRPVKVADIPPDGRAWVKFMGARIPGRKDHNAYLAFVAADVRRALTAAELTLQGDQPPPP